MTPPRSQFLPDGSDRRGATECVEYLIDGFRVSHEFGGGSGCSCVEFAHRDSCKHTREVAGRLAAQARITEHLRRDSTRSPSSRELGAAGSRRLMR